MNNADPLVLLFSLLSMTALAVVSADEIPVNYDESKIPEYTLPDPLVFNDGTPVATASQWPARRKEILKRCRESSYGVAPPAPPKITFEQIDNDASVFDDTAIRRQIVMRIGADNLPVQLVVYLPKSNHPVPGFVGINFKGNHSLSTDPELVISPAFRSEQPKDQRSDEAMNATRGIAASRWPIRTIVDRGYAVASFWSGDIDPDRDDGFHNGIHRQYPELQERDDNFATIGAWAWGLSRALDYLESDPQIDARRIAVLGHSRLGKTALWAAATDPRFAIAISNDSGAGGAALSRRQFGERVAHLTTRFPHWFCRNLSKYNNRENQLPVDQHMVFALIAPRPAYVASASDDRWADPKGEFLALKAAEPVYALLGKSGLPAEKWPPVNTPTQGYLGYHLRQGKHDIKAYDWQQYLDFADRHLQASPANAGSTAQDAPHNVSPTKPSARDD